MSKMNKPRLGRGLSSLLSIPDPDAAAVDSGELGQPASRTARDPGDRQERTTVRSPTAPLGVAVIELPISEILPNPHQPRRDFNENSINDLAASLKSTGLIQPIIVRKGVQGYELIAGERRLRAAKVAGLSTLPAIVKEVDGYTQAQMALIENIQREDLNPLDRAVAYRTLIDQLGLTQGELAGRLGEDRSAIAHYLRLLDLGEPSRELLRMGKLSVGHGKLLAGVSDVARQTELAQRVVSQELTVRNLQRLLEDVDETPPETDPSPGASSAHLRDLERSLSRQLGMKVQVKWSAKRGNGKLVIHYNLDQFDDLKSRLGVVLD